MRLFPAFLVLSVLLVVLAVAGILTALRSSAPDQSEITPPPARVQPVASAPASSPLPPPQITSLPAAAVTGAQNSPASTSASLATGTPPASNFADDDVAQPETHWAADPDLRRTRVQYQAARAALTQDPDNPVALDDAIAAGRKLGRWLVVSELLARKCVLLPEDSTLRFEHAAALMRIGRWIEAIAPLMTVVERQPERVDAWHNLALCNQALGQISEARRCWDRVVALAPNDLDARRRRGETELDLGDWKAAAEDFRAALTAPDASREDDLNLALALLRLDQLDEARELLERRLREFPDWLPGMNRLIEILVDQLADHPATAPALRRVALEWCARSLELTPAQPEILELRDRLRRDDAAASH